MERPVKCWIEVEIPAPYFLVDDGTKLVVPAILGKLPPLIPDFLREAQSHRQVPRLRSRKPRTDVIPHPVPTIAVLKARKNIEAGFEPVCPTVRDLQSLVLGVISRGNAIDHRLLPVHGEVGMDFHKGDVLRRRFRSRPGFRSCPGREPAARAGAGKARRRGSRALFARSVSP